MWRAEAAKTDGGGENRKARAEEQRQSGAVQRRLPVSRNAEDHRDHGDADGLAHQPGHGADAARSPCALARRVGD